MLRYLKKYWLFCLLAPLFMLGEIAMDMWQPAMMATIVDQGVLGGDLAVIWAQGIRMLLLVALGGSCGVFCGVFANVAAQRLGNDVRKDLFARIMDLSFQQTDQFTTGSLVTRITNDVSQVEQMVMMSMRSLVRCSLMFVGGTYMLYRQSPRFALVAACGLPVIALFVVWFLRRVSPLFTFIQQRLDRINCIVQENIAGARVVKAYVKEDQALEEFSRANEELCAVNLKAQITLAFLNPCVNMVLNLCTVGVLWLGGSHHPAGGRHHSRPGHGIHHLPVPHPHADHLYGQYFPDLHPGFRLLEADPGGAGYPSCPDLGGGGTPGPRVHPVPGCLLRLSGCPGLPCSLPSDLPGGAGNDPGHHRGHRQRQIHPGPAHPPVLRPHPGPDSGGWSGPAGIHHGGTPKEDQPGGAEGGALFPVHRGEYRLGRTPGGGGKPSGGLPGWPRRTSLSGPLPRDTIPRSPKAGTPSPEGRSSG